MLSSRLRCPADMVSRRRLRKRSPGLTNGEKTAGNAIERCPLKTKKKAVFYCLA